MPPRFFAISTRKRQPQPVSVHATTTTSSVAAAASTRDSLRLRILQFGARERLVNDQLLNSPESVLSKSSTAGSAWTLPPPVGPAWFVVQPSAPGPGATGDRAQNGARAAATSAGV